MMHRNGPNCWLVYSCYFVPGLRISISSNSILQHELIERGGITQISRCARSFFQEQERCWCGIKSPSVGLNWCGYQLAVAVSHFPRKTQYSWFKTFVSPISITAKADFSGCTNTVLHLGRITKNGRRQNRNIICSNSLDLLQIVADCTSGLLVCFWKNM